MTLLFDERTHTYTVDGRRVPSVTEILRPLYARDLGFVGADVLEYKSELGRAVHKAIELHLLDGLDYSSLAEPVGSYFDSFLSFEYEVAFMAKEVEKRVYNPIGYAGTADAVGYLNGSACVIDWKTTASISPVVAVQTAAYSMAIGPEPRARFALRLTPNSYKLVPFHNLAGDYSVFVSMLNLYRWCEANNKTLELAKNECH